MKKIQCLDCDTMFDAENKEDALKQMHPHYMEAHQDVMKDGNEEKRKEWFDRFENEWEVASEA